MKFHHKPCCKIDKAFASIDTPQFQFSVYQNIKYARTIYCIKLVNSTATQKSYRAYYSFHKVSIIPSIGQ